jgi:hypothetical protein
MKNAIKNWLIKNATLALVAVAVSQVVEPATAITTYKVGDVVTNFSFVARRQFTRPDGTVVPAGARVGIQDFAGTIVFLEWFAVWCPYCVAAAPQVEAGIVAHYGTLGGNPYAVPVTHIAVNQEPRSFYQTPTDSFIDQQGFRIVVNDYDNTSVNPVKALFNPVGQPVFVVINCLTDSPNHLPWQVLVNYLGYGQTDFNQTLANFRAVIDTVQSPALPPLFSVPRLNEASLEFTVSTQTGRSYRVQASTNLTDWTTLSTFTGSTSPIVFRDTNAPLTQRFYRAVTP